MSAAPLRQPRPSSRPGGSPRRRDHLRAVAAPEQARSLVPFAWTCVLIVVAALASVLLLNTTMSEGAYERRDLKIELADLHQQRAALITALEANSSPRFLSTTAADLGMVPASTIGFISLEDGVVLEAGGR